MSKPEAPRPGTFRTGHDPRRNPGGRRPKGAIDVQKLARVYTESAINTLVKCLGGRQAVAAAEALLERGWGKPVQPTENFNWNENQSTPNDPLQSHEEQFERAKRIFEIIRKSEGGNGEVPPKENEEVPTPEVHKGRSTLTH